MRVNYVKKATGSKKRPWADPKCSKCGKVIEKGQPYQWAKGRYSYKRIACGDCRFSRSDLTEPDENSCKKCGGPVRYAFVSSGRGALSVAFDAEMVRGGGYTLVEQEDDQGAATGRWGAFYTKLADRNMNTKAFRQHDCKPLPRFDKRDMAPVLVDGTWFLIHKANMKPVPE